MLRKENKRKKITFLNIKIKKIHHIPILTDARTKITT